MAAGMAVPMAEGMALFRAFFDDEKPAFLGRETGLVWVLGSPISPLR